MPHFAAFPASVSPQGHISLFALHPFLSPATISCLPTKAFPFHPPSEGRAEGYGGPTCSTARCLYSWVALGHRSTHGYSPPTHSQPWTIPSWHHKGVKGTCTLVAPSWLQKGSCRQKGRSCEIPGVNFFPSFHCILQAFCESKGLKNQINKIKWRET